VGAGSATDDAVDCSRERTQPTGGTSGGSHGTRDKVSFAVWDGQKSGSIIGLPSNTGSHAVTDTLQLLAVFAPALVSTFTEPEADWESLCRPSWELLPDRRFRATRDRVQ
jgi:hypothetical protein